MPFEDRIPEIINSVADQLTSLLQLYKMALIQVSSDNVNSRLRSETFPGNPVFHDVDKIIYPASADLKTFLNLIDTLEDATLNSKTQEILHHANYTFNNDCKCVERASSRMDNIKK
ncbi:hypothetical protein PUN28_015226 [Cardiocondyla obscurior]|uniref:Uncharacterized protein n=1 Tax=Cardiocondyla obscurior TaxID=286306 RepID=A0AAW2EXY6_9HYME